MKLLLVLSLIACVFAQTPANVTISNYYAALYEVWNDLDSLLHVYPSFFNETSGEFCTMTGTPCLVGSTGIANGLAGFTAKMVSVSATLGPLQQAGNVGSYFYDKVFTWKNGCRTVINGFSAFTVDLDNGLLISVNDYVDETLVSFAVSACNY